jgi:hypothetical protein
MKITSQYFLAITYHIFRSIIFLFFIHWSESADETDSNKYRFTLKSLEFYFTMIC